MGSQRVIPLQVRVDRRVIAMKGYSILLKYPILQPAHQMYFSIIVRTSLLEVALPLCKGYSQHILRPAAKRPAD